MLCLCFALHRAPMPWFPSICLKFLFLVILTANSTIRKVNTCNWVCSLCLPILSKCQVSSWKGGSTWHANLRGCLHHGLWRHSLFVLLKYVIDHWTHPGTTSVYIKKQCKIDHGTWGSQKVYFQAYICHGPKGLAMGEAKEVLSLQMSRDHAREMPF